MNKEATPHMRMRKKPNLLPRMERCAATLETVPEEKRGHWLAQFPACKAMHLELGCGKGRFTAGRRRGVDAGGGADARFYHAFSVLRQDVAVHGDKEFCRRHTYNTRCCAGVARRDSRLYAGAGCVIGSSCGGVHFFRSALRRFYKRAAPCPSLFYGGVVLFVAGRMLPTVRFFRSLYGDSTAADMRVFMRSRNGGRGNRTVKTRLCEKTQLTTAGR